MKKLLLIFIGLLSFQTVYLQSEDKDYSEAFQLIEVWLEAQKDFDHLPGITAIVVEDQKVLWKGGFGMANIEDKIKAESGTICSICSISKLFTAVAVMKLYDEGKLRLDDTVEAHLPWYDLKQQYKVTGPITIRSLLTHSSGLPREANAPYWTGPDFPFPSQTEVKAGLKKQETLYPASTYFQYSNLGLTLLGEIVEAVSGMPYEAFVQENILEPLSLKDTRTNLPENLYGSKLAIGYSAVNRQGERPKVKLFQAEGITPAAGFSSNVEDLGRFASWQFRLLESEETEILKPSTLKNMHRVHWMDPDWNTSWGLGFSVRKGSDGSTWVSHGGSCPGYQTSLSLNPKSKRAYSVMINAGGTNPGKYSNGMHGILSKAGGKKEADNEENAKDLSEYKGLYDITPWWGESYIGTWEGKLVELSLPSETPQNDMTFYKHIEGDTFRRVRDDGELGETLVFQRDPEGKIISYQQHGNYYKRL